MSGILPLSSFKLSTNKKNEKKESQISEDEFKKFLTEAQNYTDKYTNRFQDLLLGTNSTGMRTRPKTVSISRKTTVPLVHVRVGMPTADKSRMKTF